MQFKTSIFKRPSKMLWQDIQSIKFRPYRIDLIMSNATENITYDTTADISVEIKETLSEIAMKKNIEVIAG